MKLKSVPSISFSYIAYLNEEAKSYKMHWPSHNQSHPTYRIRVASLLRRRIERTIVDVLGGDHFGFGSGKGTRGIGEELYDGFTEWQKAL